jgi:hypothetical protein
MGPPIFVPAAKEFTYTPGIEHVPSPGRSAEGQVFSGRSDASWKHLKHDLAGEPRIL